MAWVTSLAEVIGGVAIMLGAAVALAAIPLTIIMLTAMFGVHWAYGFSTIKLQWIGPSGAQFGKPGYEMTLVYIAGLLALALSPPTPLSIDRWRRRSQGIGRDAVDGAPGTAGQPSRHTI